MSTDHNDRASSELRTPTYGHGVEIVAGDDVQAFRRHNTSNLDLANHVEHSSFRQDTLEDDLSDADSRDFETGTRRTGRIKRVGTFSKEYTDEEEKTIIKKFDRRLVLFISFLYLLSFIDRSNIGNARIAGLESALNLSDGQFDACLVAFYLTYITFEWMILLYRIVPAHIYISLCVLSWGIVASLQSVVTSFRQLLVLRACLGITEAAFGPGIPYFMSFFYRRSELAYRVGLQVSAAPLASSFASSLAWVIVKLSRNGPIEPWRALFLFEGFPSIITAIFAWYFIPDSPETARYLTARERKVVHIRLQKERGHDDLPTPSEKPRTRSVANFITNLRTSPNFRTLSSLIPWLQAVIFLSLNVAFASLPVFLPTIINSMSFTPLTSQILSVPPYLLSFGFVLFMGHVSDSTPDSRGHCLIACSGLGATSYFIIALFGALESANKISQGVSITIKYIAVYGAAMGLFSSVVLIVTWNLNNQPGKKEKGLSMMVMNVVGQCGPLIGVSIFPKSDGPHYVNGMVISGLFMSNVVVLAMILRWKLKRMNKKKGKDQKGSYEMVGLGSVDRESERPAAGDTEGDEAEGLIGGSNGVITKRYDDVFMYML